MENTLTTAECVQLLKEKLKNDDFKLENFTIKPISESVHGYMAEHLRVTCNVIIENQKQVHQFFIKKRTESGNDSVQDLMNVAFNLFEKEPAILEFLRKNDPTGNWYPKMLLYKAPDVIVFEDLSERNFEMAKIEFGRFDLDHCKCILTALAHLHAFSFHYERKNHKRIFEVIDIFEDEMNSTSHEIGKKWVKSCVDVATYLIEKYPNAQQKPKDVILRNLLEFTAKNYSDGMQPRKTKHSTVSHGDLWANNLMFKYEKNTPIACCLIDFQVIRYVPFTQDIIFAIYVNTDAEFRTKNYQKMLDFYFDTLTELLLGYKLDPSSIVTREEYDKLCNERRKAALLLGLSYKSFLLMERSFFTNLLMNKESGHEVVLGDRLQYVKPQLEADASFRTRIFEELPDFIEAFLE